MKTALATIVAVVLSMFAAPASATEARPEPGDWRPCATEDSPGPCVWDAWHRPDYHGHSFVRRVGGRVDLRSHQRAHRMLTGSAYVWEACVFAPHEQASGPRFNVPCVNLGHSDLYPNIASNRVWVSPGGGIKVKGISDRRARRLLGLEA